MDTLNIGVFPNPPWVNDNWQGTNKPGALIEITKMICSSLNITCVLSSAPTSEFGRFRNGSWNGMVKNIIEETFNTSVPNFSPTTERSKVINFSTTVNSAPVVYVFRNPGDVVSLWNFLTFHWSVWLCMFLAATVVGMLLAIVETASWNWKRLLSKTYKLSLDSFATILNQGALCETERKGTRVLLTFWAITALLLGTFYSAYLLTSLIHYESDLPFYNLKSFANCIKTKKCRLVTNSMSRFYMEYIQNSQEEDVKLLRNALLHNSVMVIPNENDLLNEILNTKTYFLVFLMNHDEYLAATENNKLCKYATVTSHIFDKNAFPVPKNFSLINELNEIISLFHSFGLINYMVKRYVGYEKDCTPVLREGTTPLPFKSVIGLLLVLIGGFSLAQLILLFEKAIFRMNTTVRHLNNTADYYGNINTDKGRLPSVPNRLR